MTILKQNPLITLMKNILSISALFVMSVSLFMATLGNGLVTSDVSAEKVGPSCKSFENRNNSVKNYGPLSERHPYAEQCQSKGKDFYEVCYYETPSEEDAIKNLRPFLDAVCSKPNQ